MYKTEPCCGICIEEFDEDKAKFIAKVPQCSHLFHVACLNDWITQKLNSNDAPDCPACREKFTVNAVNKTVSKAEIQPDLNEAKSKLRVP